MPRVTQTAKRIANRPLETLDGLGDQMSFYLRALAWAPRTIRRYSKEVMRLLAEVSFGSGSLAMIGGTVGVMVGLTLFVGVLVGLQGYSALNSIGTSAFTGFLTSFFNTREIAPLIAGLALSATVGAGFTAQLGAMRISEEVDALEVMGVPSLPYLVTTRILAGFVAVMPLYVVGLLSSYLASRTVVVHLYGQSAGTYDHYFDMFLPAQDVFYSFVKVLIFSVVIILTHCYYGYRATGGPAGVGIAVGRAVRLSIVTTAVLNFFIGFALWGTDTTVRIAG
ncbi:MlaE family ABC transporter permease [Saccharomonospora iraqiensis]|uniref:MlaE family ABC transporter permease n=1 Tax=Saccharomonospora iraqiensis TaxID=52698 RepID=UPI00022E5390|nr:ABC transporter permease [Saccharomonospora iraqiensis]